MDLQVGQHYMWTRGEPSNDYYRMIVRIQRVLTPNNAEYVVIAHSPEHLSCNTKHAKSTYPIGRESSLLQFSSPTGWELLDDFECWVKECRKQNEPKKNKRKRIKQTKS